MEALPARIRIKIEVEEATGCWLWTAAVDEHGYGRVGWERRNRKAHIIVHLLLVGPVADGLELDHTCKVRRCVNPDHLEQVTHGENLRRGTGHAVLSAKYAEPRSCPQGHPMIGANLSVTTTKSGNINRRCRKCASAAVARSRRRRRERERAAR